MKILSLSLIAFFITAPLSAGELSPKRGWRTRDLIWIKKDARRLSNEAAEESKWRIRDLKWKEKDIRWNAGEAEPDAPFKQREERFRAYDRG